MRIQRVKDMQWKVLTLTSSVFVATMIGAANLLSRLYYDVLQSGDSRLAVLLPAGAVALLLLLVLCCCTCYHCRSLVRGAGRLCAPWHRRPCWPKKALVSPDNEEPKPSAAPSPSAPPSPSPPPPLPSPLEA